MNKILKILICLTVGIIQLTLMPILNIESIYPNIVLIGVIVLALTDFEEEAFVLACFGGIILDLGGTFIFGLNTIILVGLVFGLRSIATKYLPEVNFVVVAIAAFIFSIIFALIMNLILGRLAGALILIDGIYGLVLALIFFWQLQRFQHHKLIFNPSTGSG